MNPFFSRAYAGTADLRRLVEFARQTTGARWPSSTYTKAGDVVWAFYGSKPGDANVRLWFDAADLAAYAWFEPPLSVDFDIRPASPLNESLFTEVLRWAEERRRSLLHLDKGAIPKAYAMLGANTISTRSVRIWPRVCDIADVLLRHSIASRYHCWATSYAC